MAVRKGNKSGKKPSEGMALAGLIINLLILPGLGSIINEKIKEGVWQIILVVIGVILILVGVFTMHSMLGWGLLGLGIILASAAWIWGLITGIKLIRESKR
ncbi:MAG: hypothetical protein HY831_05000 [Candidatus Aenigmarchaeota archaeon]|nr:hypothetical protein [Candidatus Aenigmarchaeota archaeon]